MNGRAPSLGGWIRIGVGAALWSALVTWTAGFLTETRSTGRSTLAELGDYVVARPRSFDVDLPNLWWLEVGDAVLDPQGRRVGELEALLDANGEPQPRFYGEARAVRLRIDDPEEFPVHAGASVRMVVVPEAFAWVAKTLLTEERIARLAAEWNAMLLPRRDDIFALLTPVIVGVIHDIELSVKESLPEFTARHRAELRELSRLLQEGLDDRELAELFEKEIWPVGEARLKPILSSIGREAWEKAPLWGFTWRIVYQSLPLTRDDHFERAWNEFARREITPLVRSRIDDIVAATRSAAREVLARPRIKEEIRLRFVELVEMPEFHRVVQVFIKEAFLDNPRFHDRLIARLDSPEAGRVIAAASENLEPTIRRMADILFGTREQGITAEFARVLRAQILQRDRRRFVVTPGDSAAGALDGRLRATLEWEHRP